MKIKVSETGRREEESGKTKKLMEILQIPIESIDFNYVRDCKDGGEVEKIYRILKSGEEGFYPDLEKCVKGRLGELKPKSVYLRSEEDPMLQLNDLTKKEQDELKKDLLDWTESVKQNGAIFGAQEARILPPIRNDPSASKYAENKKEKKNEISRNPDRIKQSEYDKWDKYDAESELLKLSVEEMQEAERKEIVKNKQNPQLHSTLRNTQNIQQKVKPEIKPELNKIQNPVVNPAQSESKRSPKPEEISLPVKSEKPRINIEALKNRKRLNVIIEDLHIN